MLPIPDFLAPARVFSKVLNGLLSRERWAAERLGRHEGKTIRLFVGAQSVSVTVLSGGLVQVAQAQLTPDVTLTLPLNQAGRALQAVREGSTDDVAQYLHVQGDAGLANLVAELARTLRWDFEEDLARIVGDVVATHLTKAVRSAVRGAQRSGDRLAGNVAEYLSEERGVLLNHHARQSWASGVQDAVFRLDAVERRIQLLEKPSRPSVSGGQP